MNLANIKNKSLDKLQQYSKQNNQIQFMPINEQIVVKECKLEQIYNKGTEEEETTKKNLDFDNESPDINSMPQKNSKNSGKNVEVINCPNTSFLPSNDKFLDNSGSSCKGNYETKPENQEKKEEKEEEDKNQAMKENNNENKHNDPIENKFNNEFNNQKPEILLEKVNRLNIIQNNNIPEGKAKRINPKKVYEQEFEYYDKEKIYELKNEKLPFNISGLPNNLKDFKELITGNQNYPNFNINKNSENLYQASQPHRKNSKIRMNYESSALQL